jgi:hypothetical protein
MPFAVKPLVALALLAMALPVLATDYPTAPNEMDKLCEVIGEAPNLSVPPKDRLWFKENCTCAGKAGCGNMGSERFGHRLDKAKAARDAKAKADAAEKAANAERQRVAKAAQAKKDDADRRANPGHYCPGWRDQGSYGAKSEEATTLFKKYCDKWAVEEAARIAAYEAERQAEQKRHEEAQKRQEEERQARDLQLRQAAEPLRAAFFGCLKAPNRGPGSCGMEAVALNDACLKLSTSALQNECLSE